MAKTVADNMTRPPIHLTNLISKQRHNNVIAHHSLYGYQKATIHHEGERESLKSIRPMTFQRWRCLTFLQFLTKPREMNVQVINYLAWGWDRGRMISARNKLMCISWYCSKCYESFGEGQASPGPRPIVELLFWCFGKSTTGTTKPRWIQVHRCLNEQYICTFIDILSMAAKHCLKRWKSVSTSI